MYVSDIIKQKKPVLSFEMFPPKTAEAFQKLLPVLDELIELRPDFISVTFGAGGTTRDGSLDLVQRLLSYHKTDVVAHIAGYGMGPAQMSQVLESFKKIGTENLLVIRGDAPKNIAEFKPDADAFPYASNMMEFIDKTFDFCNGAAGYPETHVGSVDGENDACFVKVRQDAGAKFIITNLFFDNNFYFDFLNRCKKEGVTIPIIPGVMPIYNLKMIDTLTKMCGASLSKEIRAKLDSFDPTDTDAIEKFGVELALDQARGLLANGAPGIHFYTMNRSCMVQKIIAVLREEGLFA